MAVCASYGIPHSTFTGWDRDDRDKALWWEIHRRTACPQCGTRPDEWNPAEGGHDHAYIAEARQCWGCAEKAPMEKKMADAAQPGQWVALVKNPEA